MKVSAQEYGVGIACSIVVGVVLGLLMGWYSVLEETLALALNIFYSLPLVALAPLIVRWFGIGLISKMVVVFVASLFPILVSTLSGVKNVDRTLVTVARSYNAAGWICGGRSCCRRRFRPSSPASGSAWPPA